MYEIDYYISSTKKEVKNKEKKNETKSNIKEEIKPKQLIKEDKNDVMKSKNDIRLKDNIEINNKSLNIKEEKYKKPIIPRGVIDYCLLLGPSNLKSIAMFSNDIRRICSNWGFTPRGSNISPNDNQNFEKDIFIWERFPSIDHADLPLPDLIEWFACSEGSITIHAINRPVPCLSTFILSPGSGDCTLSDIHGICLTFYADGYGSVTVEENTTNTSIYPPMSSSQPSSPLNSAR